ncbi:MAG: hypothetical protein IKY34_03290 [Ruminiclostridium sp.]|nr:hypothetical protein [Ruminiclostridium sp.]
MRDTKRTAHILIVGIIVVAVLLALVMYLSRDQEIDFLKPAPGPTLQERLEEGENWFNQTTRKPAFLFYCGYDNEEWEGDGVRYAHNGHGEGFMRWRITDNGSLLTRSSCSARCDEEFQFRFEEGPTGQADVFLVLTDCNGNETWLIAEKYFS